MCVMRMISHSKFTYKCGHYFKMWRLDASGGKADGKGFCSLSALRRKRFDVKANEDVLSRTGRRKTVLWQCVSQVPCMSVFTSSSSLSSINLGSVFSSLHIKAPSPPLSPGSNQPWRQIGSNFRWKGIFNGSHCRDMEL